MLRIESYVTPIILSYVDKYIKNLKPEDSQVSLWGGDAVFNNLDLRLDVLEQELRLPFSFVNGHIHELRIHVPWTKLTSEPIVITINTIECILKLKDYEGSDSESTSQNEGLDNKLPEFRRRQRSRQEIEVPPSYIQGLINKVINNVAIVCNNVILKYVEDDIVLSINAKTLELRSVNQNWTPSFIDLTSEDLMLRNLAILTDLTVCLDKRNASGKIDNYQEPLLYRCSLSCRMIRQFEYLYSHQPTSTRYDIYCPQLHFSLSDTQLPMFLRLLELLLALYYKQLRYQPPKSKSEETIINEEGVVVSKTEACKDDSWSSWMWSLGSSLIPIDWDEKDEASHFQNKLWFHSTLHMGIYVETATWVFKLTESVQENAYFGPTKMHFTPFLRVEQQGSFLTVVVRGLEAVNVQMGISFLAVEPAGSCICGIADSEDNALLEESKDSLGSQRFGFVRSGRESQDYLFLSLFDERILLGAREVWDYHYIWDNHMNSTTEGSLLERTKAFGMDYLYMMEIPSDITSERLSEINANPECSDLNERALCRMVFGPLEISVSSGFFHRISAIYFGLKQYDYTPYSSETFESPPALERPSEDEIYLLDNYFASRTYTVTCIESCVVLHASQHPMVDMRNVFNSRKRKKNQKKSADFCMARILAVPSLALKVTRIEAEFRRAMYPKRLVKTASLLRPPSAEMLHNCHSHLTLKFHNCGLSLLNEEGWPVHLMQAMSFTVYLRSLLLPHFWTSYIQPRSELLLEADQLTISTSMPQLLLLHHVVSSWLSEMPSPEELYINSLVDDAVKTSERFSCMNFKLHHVESKFCETSHLYAGLVTVGSLSMALCKANQDVISYVLNGPETLSSLEVITETMSVSEKLLRMSFQFPKEYGNESVPSIFSFQLLKMSAILGPQIISWLKYAPRPSRRKEPRSEIFFKKISEVKSLPKLSRKLSECDMETLRQESSSATLSEARTTSRILLFGCCSCAGEVQRAKSWKERFVEVYPLVSNLIVHIEIDSCTVFIPSHPINISSEYGLVNAVHRTYLTRGEKASLGDTTVLCLPHILLQNAAQKQSLVNQIHDVPIILPKTAWSEGKDKLPWSLKLCNFQVYSLQGFGESIKLPILKPVNTTATLAVNPKYKGSSLNQVGTVIHLDMSPLDFSGSRRQVEAHVSIVEGFLSLLSFYITTTQEKERETETSSFKSQAAHPKLQHSSGEKGSPPFQKEHPHPKEGKNNLSQNVHNPLIYSQPQETINWNEETSTKSQPNFLEQTKHSVSDPTMTVPLTDAEEADDPGKVQAPNELEMTNPSSVLVTAWVQWTVARVSASLYAHSSESENKKLRAEIEDLTMWVDLHQVYSKVKCKIDNLSILHFTKRGSEWVEGEHEGVIMTAGDQMSREVKVVNPSYRPPAEHPAKGLNAPAPALDQSKTHGFLSLTFTMAQCKNIHNKWNQMVRKHLREERCIKESSSPQYLSEVDIRIQPFDCIFFPLTLQSFASVYEPWLLLQVPRQLLKTSVNTKTTTPVGLSINSKVLPLMYVQTEPIRVFFPSKEISAKDPSIHNVILIQLDSMLISPQVDNPLSRITLRQDIFNAAEQARILGVPGSEVEDRQYQIDLLGFSISTGSWFDLVKVKKGRPRSLSSDLLGVRGENPALEWNNYDPTKDGSEEEEVVLYPLVARLDTRIIAAPAIVYSTMNEDGSCGEPLLVAGHSLEINATTDFDIYASLAQILLSKGVIDGLSSLKTHLQTYGRRTWGPSFSSEVLDSGVDCDMSSIDLSKVGMRSPEKGSSGKVSSLDFVPVEVLITGSKITLNIFEKRLIEGKKFSMKGWQRNKLEQRAKNREKQMSLEVASTESEPSPFRAKSSHLTKINLKHTSARSTSHLAEMEDGYEGSEEESVYDPQPVSVEPQLRFLPLLFVAISQPHTFFTCQPQHQKVDVSCFDIVVKSVPKGFSIKATDLKKLPKPEDYTTSWLETRPGDPHPKTGIPPAFLTLSAFDFLHKAAQVSIEVGRPFRLCLSQSKWDQIQRVMSSLEKVFPGKCHESSELVFERPSCSPMIHKIKPCTLDEPKIGKILREKLYQIGSVSFITNQISLNVEVNKNPRTKSELYTSLSGLKLSLLTVRKKPNPNSDEVKEAITEICFKGDLQDLQVKTLFQNLELQMLLKPWTVHSEVKLLWLHWKVDPYINIKMQSEIIQIDFGPENLFCLIEIWKYLEQFINEVAPKREKLPGNILSQSVNDEVYSDLFFQDDLRAGVFQYISCPTSSTRELFPQPYQVVFDKALGLMVWCYPEARALVRVDIYPVPFIAASEVSTMTYDTEDSDLVLCALQYYDALRDSFVTYQRFHLSESKFHQLDLPSVQEKKLLAISTVWRVCIDYRDDDDDSLKGVSPLSPEALAACMRVDSLFSVDILPTTQAVLLINKCDVSLVNHLDLTGTKLPFKLKDYTLDDSIPNKQSFITCTLDDACIRTCSWTTGSHVEANGKFSTHVLNYKFLTNNILLEHSTLHVGVSIQEAEGKKPQCCDCIVMAKTMYVHVNQSTVHTLSVASECWKQAFLVVEDSMICLCPAIKSSLPVVIMTNYILTNNTTETIRFGQVNTDENLLLESGGAHLYCWRSHKFPPKLRVCIESNKWKWCDPIHLETEGIQVCSLNQNNELGSKLLVTCKKFSPKQMCITFGGVLSVANWLSEDLEFRVVDKSNREDAPKNGGPIPVKKQTLSPSLFGDPHYLRVRASCSTIWSGEIPLSPEATKDSLTVRIPLKTRKECILALCKVYREKIGSLWRLLVFFSPHFIVRSHLPRSLTIFIATPSTNSTQQATIKGRGNCHVLNCDPSQQHQLTFQLSPELDVSKPPIPITRTLVDQVKQSSPDKSVDLTSMIEDLFQDPKENWPYIDSSFVEGDFLFADQPKIDLQIGFSSLLTRCNTLLIDVRPWALIINHTGTEILIQEGETFQSIWYIPCGAVFAPPKLENFFTFGIAGKRTQAFSVPLQLSKEERWYTLKFEGRIPRVGTTNISISLGDKFCFLTILSRYEENIQILHLVPTYSVANNTDQILSVRPLHAQVSEEKCQIPDSVSSIPLPRREVGASSLLEVPLLIWNVVKRSIKKVVEEEAVCLQVGRNDLYSHPVTLPTHRANRDRRATFTIPRDFASDILNESFILTSHPVDNRVKFIIQKDPSPQMLIHNNASVLLLLGQGSLEEEEGIIEEEMNVFASVSSVPPNKAVFYTFPTVSSIFPDVTPVGAKRPRLHFSVPHVLTNSEAEETLWSQGLDIQQHYDQFVCIPGFGDVKIHIEKIGHTAYIYIDPASRIEISAKDIRSRIATPLLSSHRTIVSPIDTVKGEEKNVKCDVELKKEVKEESSNGSPAVVQPEFITATNNEEMKVFYFSFSCSEFSLIVKDDMNDHKHISEVLRISLDNFIVILRPQLNLSEKLRALNFRVRNSIEVTVFVGDAQIDNQMFSEGNFDFPVVLVRQRTKTLPPISPLDPIERVIQTSYNDALFAVSLILEDAASLLCVQTMNVRFKPLTLYVEDALICTLAGFVNSFIGACSVEPFTLRLRRDEDDEEKIFLKMRLPAAVLVKSNAMTKPIQINHFQIENVSVLLSIHASVKLYIAVDQSPLHFKEYHRTEVMTTGYSLGHNLAMHYLSSALLRAGWVVTSLDLLGNPGGFARTVGSGIRDFVQLPYEGILQGPWAFIAGITHGSLSLVKHITAGTLVSVTNLASSVARNMERLSLDEDHLTRNEANRRIKPKGLANGVVQGLSSLGISILGAIGGLAHQPIQAVLCDGMSPSSLVGGLGKGIVGAVAKPIGGAADFFVHTGQGLLHGTGWKRDLTPRIAPVKEPYSDIANAFLKVNWKLLAALPKECRHVICAADATLVTSSGSFLPVTVLLTPQVIFIVGIDEDAQQHALTLHELEWKCHLSDPTLLYLEKSSPPLIITNDDAEPISGCPERVADYVRSTCSEGVDGGETDNDSAEEELRSRKKPSRVKLYLSSQLRSFLVSCINVAVRATKGKGFIS